MSKTFVIDTNVILQSPNALLSFGADNKVVLTEAVLEELDNFKKGNSELNINARVVSRFLDELRNKGRLTEGVKMSNDGILKVETNHRDVELPQSWDNTKADNRILQVCKALQDQGEEVYLITKDILERIKADIMDVIAEDFEFDRAPKLDEQYKGRSEIYVSSKDIDSFYKDKFLILQDLKIYDENGNEFNDEFTPNGFVVMHALENPKQTALGIINNKVNSIKPLNFVESHPYGVTPRNVGQRFMQEALMMSVEDAPLVILTGEAGTAKTFYSLAVGLEKVVENHEFRRILVCRPNMTMDEDIGFLPGDEKDKIAPLMRPIYDNLEILVDSDPKERYSNENELANKVRFLFDKGYIDTQAVGFLRGRSIVDHWLIIDEAQNLTPRQAKAIITRAGEGTKIIFCGDPNQIDNPFLDSRTNGLSYASAKMKDSPLCVQITMENDECVRSKLAFDAINRLKD